MALTTATEAELDERTTVAFRRTVALLRDVDPQQRLAFGDWTARDVAAHLLTVQRRYTRRDFRSESGLSAAPQGLTAQNGSELAELGDEPMGRILDSLEAEFPEFLQGNLALHDRFPFHAAQTIDGIGARANWLGELVMHGYDVARAAKVKWPFDQRNSVLQLHAGLQVAPGWLDSEKAAGVRLTVAMHVPGTTAQLFEIADGRCEVRDAASGDHPDAVIRSRATPLLLLFFGRLSLPKAVSRGLLVTGGRRPWRGAALSSLFLPV
jgi:uncharacterized protein (TIGR03083 family)